MPFQRHNTPFDPEVEYTLGGFIIPWREEGREDKGWEDKARGKDRQILVGSLSCFIFVFVQLLFLFLITRIIDHPRDSGYLSPAWSGCLLQITQGRDPHRMARVGISKGKKDLLFYYLRIWGANLLNRHSHRTKKLQKAGR